MTQDPKSEVSVSTLMEEAMSMLLRRLGIIVKVFKHVFLLTAGLQRLISV